MKREYRSSLFFSPGWIAVLLAALYAVLLAPFLGMSSIGGSSEARETHVAALVYSTGEWVSPLRNGIVPSKPILFHWVTALLGELRGGVTPGVARATSLLFGAGTVALTALLGFGLSRGRGEESRRTISVLSVFVLTTIYGFTQLALDARVDMTFTFFVTLALAALVLPFTRENPRAGSYLLPLGGFEWALFYGACGGAVLAKGPIGFALPGLLGFLSLGYLVGMRRAIGAFLRPRWGWLVFLGVALPWYLLAIEQHGAAFVERQIIFENLLRFTGAEHMNNQPPWFYLESVLRGASPWWIFFLFFAFSMPRRTAATPYGAPDRSDARLQWLGVVWFLGGLVFLSLASGKRHSYLLPLFPGLAVVVAYGLGLSIERLSDGARARWNVVGGVAARWVGVVVVLILAALVVGLTLDFAAAPFGVIVQRWFFENRVSFGIAGCLILVLHLRWLGGGRVSPRGAWGICGVSLVWLLAVGITVGYGVKSELKGFDRMARVVRERIPADAPLILLKTRYNEYFDPFLLYLERTVTIAPPEPQSIVCGAGEHYLARRDWFEDLLQHGVAQVEEVVSAYQTYDQIVGRTDRGIVLFRCRS